MAETDRTRPAFWRREHPELGYDIEVLRPAKPKGKRFETPEDAQGESERSEELLRPGTSEIRLLAETLRECRQGDYQCNQAYCPICARSFRRWLIGELLRLTEAQSVQILTVLLKAAKQNEIGTLDPTSYSQMLRKRLQRAGLKDAPVIGGYEIVYRAQEKQWLLHINLVVIGAETGAIEKFKQSFAGSEIERPVMIAPLRNPAEQLSYILKFTTYHRPNGRTGARRQAAKPLNRREHQQLVKWMGEFAFQEFLFLFNARRRGSTIVLG